MKKSTRLILILGAIAALGPFSIDMYLAGFPNMARDLDTDIAMISLTLSSYFVGIALGQMAYGPLLDRFGRKRPLMLGFVLYFIAALGCAWSPNVESLIVFRFLMALGGSAGMVASRAVIRDRFEQAEMARAFSSLILVMGLAPIVAPMLGGFMIESMGWRSIFYFMAAYVTAIGLLTFFALNESRHPDRSVSLRPVRIAQKYWHIMRNRQFLVFAGTGSLALAILFSYIAGAPFVLRELLGYSETEFGWVFGGNAVGFIAASQFNRALLKRYSTLEITHKTAVVFALFSLTLALQAALGLPSPPLFLLNLFVVVAGLGFLNPNLQAMALDPFRENAGVAAALVGSLRMVSGAIASLLVSLLHDGTARPMFFLIALAAVGISFALWYFPRRFSLTLSS